MPISVKDKWKKRASTNQDQSIGYLPKIITFFVDPLPHTIGFQQGVKPAKNLWISLLNEEGHLHTTNYIIIETLALLQNHLGFEAAPLYSGDILGLVDILWVNEPSHKRAFEIWLSLGRKKLSLVDCVSFTTMHHYELENVF